MGTEVAGIGLPKDCPWDRDVIYVEAHYEDNRYFFYNCEGKKTWNCPPENSLAWLHGKWYVWWSPSGTATSMDEMIVQTWSDFKRDCDEEAAETARAEKKAA